MSYCMLCKVVHAAGMMSRHEEGLARPGALASAMLDDRVVETPLHKRRRRTKKNSKHTEGSTLSGMPNVERLNQPLAFGTGGDADTMQELEALRRAMQAGPWEAGLEDKDEADGEAEEEEKGADQEDVDKLYDPAEDDEVGYEAWMVEMEEAAKRDIQDFGKQ
jgi:hypothetical protein